jgi:very-short-patch-repair endonuclease
MLAARQHGLVTRAQLTELGLGRGAVEHRIATGALHVVRRGVYAVGHTALRPQAHLLAAMLWAGAGAALSHVSAASAWGIRPSSSAWIDVTVPRPRRGTAGIRVHHVVLAPEHVTVRDGIALTTVERTVYDCAGVWRREILRRSLEAAEAQRLVDWRLLEELAAGGGGRRGIRALRAILAERSVGVHVTRSELEAAFLDLLRAHGLPLPATNVLVEGFEVDCVWFDSRLVVELDGRRHHATAGAFERDRHRDRVLAAAGWRPVRVTWRQVHGDGRALARDMARLLRTR